MDSSPDRSSDQRPVRETAKSLTLSLDGEGDRLQRMELQSEQQTQFAHKAKAAVAQMADEMARTQLMLAIEVASATLSGTSRSFRRQAEEMAEDAARLIQDLHADRPDAAL